MSDAPVIWEAECDLCGETVMTDQSINGYPYFDACDCGGSAEGDPRISDEPHPSLYQ